jgi:small neutral amino acid transporter SnatA (MarC family)
MNIAVALIAAVATINPLRLWPGLPGGSRHERMRLTAAGAALVLLAVGLIAAFADPILGALDISDPTARIAAGVAIVVVGVRDSFSGPAEVEPSLAGWWAALVPVALPHLFAPGITLLAVSVSVDRGPGVAALVLMPAMLAVVIAAAWPAPSGAAARACRAGHVLTAGLALALGGALMLDGVLDI